MKRVIQLLGLGIVLTSCLPAYNTKNVIRTRPVNKEALSQVFVGGKFQNKSINGKMRLWDLLCIYSKSGCEPSRNKDLVEIKLIDAGKTLQVTLTRKSGAQDVIYLKGKKRDEYFSINDKFKLYPLFPLFYINQVNKTVIANDTTNNLILKEGYHSDGWVLIIGGAEDNGVLLYEFQKFDDSPIPN